MDQHHVRLLQYLCIILFLFRNTTAQLVGSIKKRPSSWRVDIEITNPTDNTISVLKWNNAFDHVTPLPHSLIVRDGQDRPIHLASTYAMRAGMTDEDFYHFLPQAHFNIGHDLRTLVHRVPNRLHGNVTVNLQRGFKGISHSGTWTVPPEAAANLTGGSPKLGDFTAADLQDIVLTSPPTSLQLGPPHYDENRPPVSTEGGIQIDTEHCTAEDSATARVALIDAGTYAKALSLAAKGGPSSPLFFNYFSSLAQPIVGRIALLAQMAMYGRGPRVKVSCTGQGHTCASSTNILGHSSTPSWLGDSQITLCRTALELPQRPLPCTKNPGVQISATTSHVMLHLVLSLGNVVGETLNGNTYGSGACRMLKSSRILRATENPDSYAQLAIALWAYGFGAPPYYGPKCPPPLGFIPDNQ
ncbi:MAG: hypothetical protein Q9216_006356 [Gyalolechia sp. 2 TL-2023]